MPEPSIKLWLITPVKPFEEGKSRLAKVLSAEERTSLNQQLLTNVLTVVNRAQICSGMIVISRSSAALHVAASCGAIPMLEEKQNCGLDSLNAALQAARGAAVSGGADAILVLPADLPWIEPEDIRQLYAAAQQQPGVVLVPSRDGGTNALLLRPPAAIEFAFGYNSFQRHQQLAAAAGTPCRVMHLPNLAIDIDQPQDLALLATPPLYE